MIYNPPYCGGHPFLRGHPPRLIVNHELPAEKISGADTTIACAAAPVATTTTTVPFLPSTFEKYQRVVESTPQGSFDGQPSEVSSDITTSGNDGDEDEVPFDDLDNEELRDFLMDTFPVSAAEAETGDIDPYVILPENHDFDLEALCCV